MASYDSITLAALRQSVREQLIPTFWTDEEIDNFIKEGLKIWNCLTLFYKQNFEVSLEGARSYPVTDIDETVETILKVRDSEGTPFTQLSLQELSTFNPDWRNDIGIPHSWVPLGLNRFVLYPALTTEVEEEEEDPPTIDLIFDTVGMATVPVEDEDFIQLNNADISALTDYAKWAATVKEGGEELQTAMPLLKNFLQQAAKHNSKLLKSAAFARILGMPAGGQENPAPAALEQPMAR